MSCSPPASYRHVVTLVLSLLAVISSALISPLSLGIGTNLGDTLEAPFEGDWHRPAQEYYFADFKSAGFSTVRIPIRWDNHTGIAPPYAVNATWMARVQTVVGWCLSQGLQCIINSHWDTWLDQADDASFQAALPRYISIWEQVSTAFEGAPPGLFFESFNEPHLMSVASLNAMLAAFHAAVRPLHPTRQLVLGWLNYMSPSWIQENAGANWDAMALPGNGSDPNLAVETHSYDPYEVCGTGTEPWGKPSDVEAMKAMFGNTSLWSAQHGGLPVFMGECGCTKKQNRTDRLAWYAAFFDFVRTSPGQGGGGLVWDDEEDFEVYNRTARTFDSGILGAIGLLPPTPTPTPPPMPLKNTAEPLVLSASSSSTGVVCGLSNPPSSASLGALAARPSLFSPPSPWSVGGETLDRGYTNLSAWLPYLGPLGVGSIRLQAGWARCDPLGTGAPYVWAWLDEAVEGALAAGVQPWLQLSFGNSAYEGGGTASSSSPLPVGTLALAGWDAWVLAAVARYAPKLGAGGGGAWEIWNEPNIQNINATAYAIFSVRTAELIRSVASGAEVRFGVLAGVDTAYAAALASAIAQTPGGPILQTSGATLTYHPYVYNPDSSYAATAALRSALDAGGLERVGLMQGENGAPSQGGGYGALTDYNWTECSQAKYFARRLLGDGARGIPSSAFSIIDLCYEVGGNISINHKGLLAADCNAPGYPSLGPKLSYAAVMHAVGVLDGTFSPLPPSPAEALSVASSCGEGMFAGAWLAPGPDHQLVFALWNATGTPLSAEASSTILCDVNVTITISQAPPPQTSYAGVDILLGSAFAVSGGLVDGSAGTGGSLTYAFTAVPYSDTPLLLAPPSVLRLVPPPPANASGGALPSGADIAALMEPLLEEFEAAHAAGGDTHWERAAFFFGLSASLALPLARDHAPYALAWAAANNFSCNGSLWPGDLGVAWTVSALVARGVTPPSSLLPLAQTMDEEVAGAPAYFWSWVDTLAFNVPELLAYGAALGRPSYATFAAAQYRDTRDGLPGNSSAPGLWSATHGLWWRDAAARAATAPNGEPVFWARGNGWAAIAAVHALELGVLPPGDALRADLESMLIAMAEALAPLQGSDGLWRSSLLDAASVPNPEASGSGAFLALFAYGVRSGLLPAEVYLPIVSRAWAGLATTIVAADASRVGFCQPVGASPAPANSSDTSDFCLGLVLEGAAQTWALTTAATASSRFLPSKTS